MLLIIRELQANATVSQHFTPTSRESYNNKFIIKPLSAKNGECEMAQPAPVESSLAAPQVAQTDLSHDTAKKLLCISTRKLKPYSLETL